MLPGIRQLRTPNRNWVAGNPIALLPIVLKPHVGRRLRLQRVLLRGLRAALIVHMGIGCAEPAYAQATAAGRPDFSGTWTFDSYLSDNPEQVARALETDTGQPGEEALVGRGTERGGFGGVGRGAGGRDAFGGQGRSQREPADQMSPDDRKKLTELTDAVQFASPTLTIAQMESAVTIAGSRGGTQTLSTNGKAEKYTLEAGAVDRVARWEGPTLLVDYDVGHAGTLTYTYALVPTTKQLLIRVNFERVRGQPGPFDIKLIYNRAGQP